MATEMIDAKHEAIVALYRAISEAEAGDRHEAELATHTALAWLREMPSRPQPYATPIQPQTFTEPV